MDKAVVYDCGEVPLPEGRWWAARLRGTVRTLAEAHIYRRGVDLDEVEEAIKEGPFILLDPGCRKAKALDVANRLRGDGVSSAWRAL